MSPWDTTAPLPLPFRLAGSALLAAAIALAFWSLPLPQAVFLALPLLVLGILLWVWRSSVAIEAPEPVVVTPPPAERALAGSARLHALESELASLRGVQRELLAAKQAAESAMLAKSEFLATMSHEIRTPLNGILPLLDIVLGMDMAPTQRDYLVTAHKSAQELLRIVDDILDYSKVEAGKLDLERVGVNLRELMENVQRLMEKPAEAKGLALRIVVDPDVRTGVRGDPVRLRQILGNLVGNAIKFTERGGVSVRVSRRSETATRHEVLFAVRDTGIGLSAEAAQRLFQPFSQADASVTRRYGGTGLGLTICKKLVDLMGGKIGVRSEPSRGSVFWFSIPFEKMPGDIAGTRQELTELRTLLVCGTARAQRLRPQLESLGLEVVHLPGAAEALARLRQAAPLGHAFAHELLIADAAGLGGDAGALLRNVLRDPHLAAVRMLVLGGSTETDPRIGSLPRDASDAALRDALQNLFGFAPRERAAPLVAAAPRAPAAGSAERALHGRVLLVEDHPVNQQVAKRLLERLGLHVEVANNGAEALERLEHGRHDLVLMDCQMPVLDGYSATRRLREREQSQTLPRLPVIAMTAHAMAGDRERCLESGMDDYLTKPLDRVLLADTLARWLDLAGTPPTPPLHITAATETAPVVATAAAAHAVRSASPAPNARTATMIATHAPASNARMATAAPVISTDALDEATLSDLEDVVGADVRTLVQTYLRDGDARIADLHTAAARGDAAEVGRLAHALKSSSANLGALALAAEAKSIEEAARTGTLADPTARVPALARLYAQAAAALRVRFGIDA